MLWALLIIFLGDVLGVEAIKRLGTKVKRYRRPITAVLFVLLAFATLVTVGIYL